MISTFFCFSEKSFILKKVTLIGSEAVYKTKKSQLFLKNLLRYNYSKDKVF
jgi:hypothetical protein